MKIQIIGFSGAGKSTLSKQLSKFHNLPVIHMDSLNFLDNWVERDRTEFNNIVNEFLDTNDSWVIDGNYFRIAPKRYEQADLVIYLKYNRITCLNGVISRYKKYKNSSRPDMASGCKERLNFSFLMWVLFTGRTRKRRKHMEAVVKNAKSSLVFKNRKQLKNYLKKEGVI